MRSILVSIITFFIISTVIPRTAHADFSIKKFSLRGGMGAWLAKDGNVGKTDNERLTAYGDFLVIGYQPHSKLRGELSFSFWGNDDIVNFPINGENLGGRASIHMVPVILTGHFFPKQNDIFHPYIGLGLGLYLSSARQQLTGSISESEIDKTKRLAKLGFNLTAGTDIELSRGWQFVFDVKYHLIKFNEQMFEDHALLGDPRNFNGFQATFGFRIYIPD